MLKHAIFFILTLVVLTTTVCAQGTVSVVNNDSLRLMKHDTKKALKLVYEQQAKTFVYPVQLNPLKTDSVIELDPKQLMKYYPQSIKNIHADTFKIDYVTLIPLLVQSIKELTDKNNKLHDDLYDLKTALSNQSIAMKNMQNVLEYKMNSLDSEISSFRGNFLTPKKEVTDSTGMNK